MSASPLSAPGNSPPQRQPPVVIVAGDAGTLSLLRAYRRKGIECHVLTKRGLHVSYSRCAHVLPYDDLNAWRTFLLGQESDWLRGALLLAGDDDNAVQLLAENHECLRAKFLLDLMNPAATAVMLDKLQTYRRAQACGVDVPRYWEVRGREDVLAACATATFPLLLKPLFSPSFRRTFGRKFFRAHSPDELGSLYQTIQARGDFPLVLMEMIPGPDDLIASYYSYVDESGRCVFDFTKTAPRRHPMNEGYATYHVSSILPEVALLGRRFLICSDYRGFAGVEFKRDLRDGKWKLIECNARVTAPTQLLQASGCNVAMLIYNRAVGLPLESFVQSQLATRLWLPLEDLQSFRMLHHRGELTLARWLRSVMHLNELPFFSWSDPLPTITFEARRLRQLARRFGARLLHPP